MKAGENNEKVRVLFNKLKSSIPTLSSLPKLNFKIPMIYFKIYQHHINTFASICEKNVLFKLSWMIFRSLFEGKEEFLQITKEKEADLNLLIDIIKGNCPIKETIKNLLIRAESNKYKKEFSMMFIDIEYVLEYTLKIDQKIVCLVLLYLLNNDISLPLFVETIVPILKDKFPYSEIKINKALNSGVSLRKFLEDFDFLMYSFDNYKILEWDENENTLKVTGSSSEEILKLWNIEDNKQIKNKTKEVEAKFEGMKISNEINQEAESAKSAKSDNLDEKLKKKFEDELIKQRLEKLIEENNALKKELLEKNSIIEENRYYLKMIGLRVVYKSIVDILIYIFKLDETGNLNKKVRTIQNYLDKKSNNKKLSIKNTITNISEILEDSNSKAHYINFEENILSQLIEILRIFSGDNESQILINLFDSFNAEKYLKDLVEIRSKKYNMNFEDYKAQEKDIVEKIKKNLNNENGIKFLDN